MKGSMVRWLAFTWLAIVAATAAAQDSREIGGRQCSYAFDTWECVDLANRAELEDSEKADWAFLDSANGRLAVARKSGDSQDMATVLRSIAEHVKRSESTFARYPASPAEQQHFGEPLTNATREIQADFKRLGWPIPASPSSAFEWAAAEMALPYSAHEAEIGPWAERTLTTLRSQRLSYFAEARKLASVHAQRLADGKAQDAVAKERRAEDRKAEVDALRTANEDRRRAAGLPVGPTLGQRAATGLQGLLGAAVVAALLAGFAMRRGVSRPVALKMAWSLVLFSAAFIPVIVLLGGVLPRVSMWWSLVLYIVGSCVFYVFLPWNRISAAVVATLGRFRLPAALSLGWASLGAGSTVTGTHGTARWGSVEDATKAGHLLAKGNVLADSHGFALGRVAGDRKWAATMDTRFRYMGHLATIAKTGAGKGVGAVIPALLEYPGSTVVIDIKGENYAVTSRFRRERLGHAVYLVDPFGVTGEQSHNFNWLDLINPDDEDVVGEAEALAEMLVISNGNSSDNSSHFNDKARSLLRALIIQAACADDPAKRTLGEVRRMLTLAPNDWLDLLTTMSFNERGFGIPAREAFGLTRMADEERGSVISTAMRHTAFLDDPRITRALASSDFSLADIKTTPMTVYLVIPPNRLEANARFLRGFIHQAVTAVTKSDKGKARYKVAFLLDEFAQLGYIPSIEKAVSLLRGYGVVFWFFLQDLEQLKVYPRWSSFLSACAKQVFGTNDLATARWVSEQLGKATIEFHTKGQSQSSGLDLRSGSSSGSDNQQFMGRELLTPDEVMRMSPTQPLLLLPGEAPYQVERLTYYSDPEYTGLYDENPYEKAA